MEFKWTPMVMTSSPTGFEMEPKWISVSLGALTGPERSLVPLVVPGPWYPLGPFPRAPGSVSVGGRQWSAGAGVPLIPCTM